MDCSSSFWAQENTRNEVFRLFTEASFPQRVLAVCHGDVLSKSKEILQP